MYLHIDFKNYNQILIEKYKTKFITIALNSQILRHLLFRDN